MTADAYSALKILHHPERVAALRQGQPFAPAQVQLILSDWCNHHCAFCAYRMEGYASNQRFAVEKDGERNSNPYRMMSTSKALEIVLDCAAMGVSAIQLTGGGEPLAHPDHLGVMAAVLEGGMELALVTNGTLLKDETVDLLMSAAWVRVSLDAGME